uniref:Flavin-containing monooxygenase n=1 Tax=Lygus hesperus TaxID=30085 RepID=A0A146M6H0_LYGHE
MASYYLLLVFSITMCALWSVIPTQPKAPAPRVAIIGGGAAGLVTAKTLLEVGWTPDLYEQYDTIGGTWNYDESHTNKHSAMYKNLRTNLPKELMLMEGLDYKTQDRSYLNHTEVLDYLNDYVVKFDLKKVIKFETKVTNVVRSPDDNWVVTSHHLPSGTIETREYDAVFVCNGHYFLPNTPKLEGADSFKGRSIHSHAYRVPENFAGQKVLIIGSGPSGRDIAVDLAPHVKKVYLSHHEQDLDTLGFPKPIELKPDVSRLEENAVIFADETKCEVDAIIYCTGYEFSFPFLDDSCGVNVDENYVNPLYIQIINIRHPTMFFIGLPFRTFIFQMLELQAKCCLRVLTGDAQLPSEEEMEDARQREIESLKNRGYPKRKYHLIAAMVKEYLSLVAEIGGLPPLNEVFYKIYYETGLRRKNEFLNYRNYVYKILDERNFNISYRNETEK